MKATETPLAGCYVIEPTVFEDERGYFFEGFNQEKLEKAVGATFNPVQLNQSRSSIRVLRGLHFQKPPHEQAKLVSCTEGEILDVAVDIRPESKTYGQHFSIVLTDENKKSLFVPKGFAHGFMVLSQNAKIMYLVNTFYSPKHDAGIYYNDSKLNIDWGLKDYSPILSKKDASLPTLDQINLNV